jgi:hypothetical protein
MPKKKNKGALAGFGKSTSKISPLFVVGGKKKDTMRVYKE